MWLCGLYIQCTKYIKRLQQSHSAIHNDLVWSTTQHHSFAQDIGFVKPKPSPIETSCCYTKMVKQFSVKKGKKNESPYYIQLPPNHVKYYCTCNNMMMKH